MVAFNQPDQDIQPANTAFWARPIREPKVDISGEIIGKTVGNALGEGLKFADNYVREGIVAPTAETEAGKLRDQFVDALNTARNSIEPQPLGAPKSLSEGERAALPKTVQNVGDRVDILQKAMESGRLSETDYYGRVNALAKQLRAQFPGYRDEVDRQIARVTGVHSANAQLRSQIQDLNRLITQHGETKDKFDTEMSRAAFNGLFDDATFAHFQQMHRDNPDKFGMPELLREINRRAFNKADFERMKEDAFMKGQTAKDEATKAQGAITSAVGTMVSDAMATEKITVGTYSNQSMDDFLSAYGQGKVQVADEDMEAQGRMEQVRYNQMYAKAMAMINQPDPNDPQHRSLAQLLKGGDKTAKEIVEAAMDPWRKRVEAFAGKDPVMGNMHAKLIESSQHDNQYLARKTDPYIANTGDLAEMFRKQYGPGFDNYITTTDVWNKKITPSLQALFDQNWFAARTQPRMKAGGSAYEFVRTIQDYANQSTSDPNFVRLLARGIDDFNNKDTDPETRKALGYYFFGPNSGQLVVQASKGDINIFQQLYTPLTARTMSKYHPDMYPMFEQGAEQNARALFTKDINDLKTVLEKQVPGTAGINWVNGDHFEGTGEGRLLIQGKIDRINAMIGGLKPVYDGDPAHQKDVETFMFERLAQMGFDPTKNVAGLPEQIMKALMASRGASGATEKPAGASKSDQGTETP